MSQTGNPIAPTVTRSRGLPRQIGSVVLTWAAVVAVNVPTLFRGQPPAGSCGQLVPFLPGLPRFQNCDSPLFNRLAQDPGLLLSIEGENRQARPGFPVLGWLADQVMHLASLGSLDASGAVAPGFTAAEFGYLLLNSIVLTAAVILLLRILRPIRAAWGLAALTFVLLAANPVTRAFFWTSHTQMWNLFVPVLAIVLTARVLRARNTWMWLCLCAVGLGLAVSVYALTAVAIASAVIALLVKRQWLRALVFGAISVAPMAAWWAVVQVTTGGFVSVETRDHRQFVWIADALHEGGVRSLAAVVNENIGWFVHVITDAQTVEALLILIVAYGALLAGTALSPTVTPAMQPLGEPPDSRFLIGSIAIVLPVQIAFLYLMGFYQTRLAWGIVAVFITGLPVLYTAVRDSRAGLNSRWLQRLLVGLAIVWYVLWLSIQGPWH